MVNRTCGDCNVCCEVLEIPELKLPMYQKCDHMVEGKCELFNKPERPKVCKAWYCFWLAEGQEDYRKRTNMPLILRREDRPDKSGIFFAFREVEGAPSFIAYESWKGSSFTGPAKDALKKMSKLFQIFLRRFANG